MKFKQMYAGEDGWSEWVHPKNHDEDTGYLMQCCDCDLVHELEFTLGTSESGDNVLLFRARRWPRKKEGDVDRHA